MKFKHETQIDTYLFTCISLQPLAITQHNTTMYKYFMLLMTIFFKEFT